MCLNISNAYKKNDRKNVMRSIIILFQIVLLLLISATVYGQSASSAPLDQGTIQSKFSYMISETERFKEHQIIRRSWIRKVRDHVADSLNTVRAELKQTQNVVSTQKAEIDALKSELAGTNENLTAVTEEKDSISFFGGNTAKGTYKSIMWGIVAGLSILSAILFLSFKRSNSITSRTQEVLKRTQDDFDAYRERTLKKEQKIMRRLQDELNKNA